MRTFAKKITSILLVTSLENAQAHHFHLKSAPLETQCFARPTFTSAPPTTQVLDSSNIESSTEKPIVSEHEYMCALGTYYNLTCDQVWEAHELFEETRLKDTEPPLAPDAPYLIEPKTHRVWLTSPENPKEVPVDQLSFYEKSLQFYVGKPFEHHFWCNGAHLIPETIAAIQHFNVFVSIHDITEIFENFTNKNLFKKLMKDQFFAFAANILRQEIVLQVGGLYMDIGLEQTQDLTPYFQKYEGLLFSSIWNFMIDTVFGAKKGSPLLLKSLTLKREFPYVLPILPVKPDPKEHIIQRLNSFHAWRVIMAQMEGQLPPIVITDFAENFVYHGFESWSPYKEAFTVDYFPKEDSKAIAYEKPMVSAGQYFCNIATNYNIKCPQLWAAQGLREDAFNTYRNDPIPDDAPFLIEPKTHRIWFTSPDAPKEVPTDRLAFYANSLQFYKDKSFEHHFWCNGAHLIPQTIKIIKQFVPPVIIHEIIEVEDTFITKPLFRSFLKDRHFSKASNLARQELLLKFGGLYADIGLEQLKDIEEYFKKYEWISVVWKWLDIYIFASQMNSPTLRSSLNFINQMPKLVALSSVAPAAKSCLSFTSTDAWRLSWALEKDPKNSTGFLYEGVEVKHHGLASWYSGELGTPNWRDSIECSYYENFYFNEQTAIRLKNRSSIDVTSNKPINIFFDYVSARGFLWYKTPELPMSYYIMDIVFDVLKDFGKVSVVQTAEEANLVIVLPHFKKGKTYQGEHQGKAVIGISGETYVFDPQIVTLSMAFNHIEHERYLRFPFYLFKFKEEISPEALRSTELLQMHSEFCGYLTSEVVLWSPWGFREGTQLRDVLFKKLSEYKSVKSGGKNLNNIGTVVPHNKTQEWLSQFKFVICYENQSYDGYITEKVFNAYYAGAIPIYYADRSVLKDINHKAIIFAPDFENEEALIEHIIKVDNDDALYRSIWEEPLMVDPYYSYDAYQQRLREKLAKHIIPYL